MGGRNEDEVVKTIKDKKNTDFCGIYELYYHDNLKKECFKIQHQGEEGATGSGAYEEEYDPFASNNNQYSSNKMSSTSCSSSSK
jgi:hypothetical protein